jgi:hypothetical protein
MTGDLLMQAETFFKKELTIMAQESIPATPKYAPSHLKIGSRTGWLRVL